jgi:hypothetical protein
MIFVRSAFFFNERYWLSQDDAYCDERLEIQEILQGTRMQSFSFSFFWMIPSVVIKPAVKKRHCYLLQLSRRVEGRSQSFCFCFGFCCQQFIFRISPFCCLEKTNGASVRRVSLLDSKFDDPSSTLEGIFCPQRVM